MCFSKNKFFLVCNQMTSIQNASVGLLLGYMSVEYVSKSCCIYWVEYIGKIEIPPK